MLVAEWEHSQLVQQELQEGSWWDGKLHFTSLTCHTQRFHIGLENLERQVVTRERDYGTAVSRAKAGRQERPYVPRASAPGRNGTLASSLGSPSTALRRPEFAPAAVTKYHKFSRLK